MHTKVKTFFRNKLFESNCFAHVRNYRNKLTAGINLANPGLENKATVRFKDCFYKTSNGSRVVATTGQHQHTFHSKMLSFLLKSTV